MDSFRIRYGAADLREDTDGDGMVDVYEIMRSLHSDQYDPFVHNTRFAVLVAAVREDAEELEFKEEAQKMRLLLLKLGYTDDDIVYLTNTYGIYWGNNNFTSWDNPIYDVGVDGDGITENIRLVFQGLQRGGKVSLKYPCPSSGLFESRGIWLPRLDRNDTLAVFLRGHGGEMGLNPYYPGKAGDFYFATYSPNGSYIGFYRNDPYPAYYIRSDLRNVTVKYSGIIVDACFSGNLVEGNYTHLAESNWYVVVSCPSNSKSARGALFFPSRLANERMAPLDNYYARNGTGGASSIYPSRTVDGVDGVKMYAGNWIPHYTGNNTANVVVSFYEAYQFAQFKIKVFYPKSIIYSRTPLFRGDLCPEHFTL